MANQLLVSTAMSPNHTQRRPALRGAPVYRHLGFVLLLCLVIVVRWWSSVFSPVPLFDEQIYLDAFATLSAGESPYAIDGYYYPSAFARLGSWLLDRFGQVGVLVVMRLGVVFGLAVTVWLSVVWWIGSNISRLLVAGAILCLAPAVGLGMRTGNVSFLVVGAVILALMIWRARPVASGLLLGASCAIKPFAPVATLALMAHRPPGGGMRQLLAGTISGLTMVIVLLPISGLVEMSAQAINSLSYRRSISFHRLFALAGVETHPLVVVMVVAVVTLVVASLRPWDESSLLSLALTAALLSVPLIWTHTLLLVLPVQVIALMRANQRRRTLRASSIRSGGPAVARRYEMWMIVIAVAAIQLAEGFGAVDEWSAAGQMVILTLGLAAPIVLAIYVLVTSQKTFDQTS